VTRCDDDDVGPTTGTQVVLTPELQGHREMTAGGILILSVISFSLKSIFDVVCALLIYGAQ
jgi:hypothetical protein